MTSNGHRPVRLRPLRTGIVNVWQYDEQTFELVDGRLILHGENATGKSKALEVLLPFLLDADTSAARLDPFGGQAKTMRWNLLENGVHDSRIGYVWMEFASLERTVTIGAGLHATTATSGVDSWYFVTSQRVGVDLHVTTPDGTPLRKDALRRAVGDRGTVFETAREYRTLVDRELFGLGADRYRALVELLLRLRRPQLSAKLDPDEVSRLLTQSLPPLETEVVDRLSEGFERLDHESAELEAIRAAARAVDDFLADYRGYARGVARARAGALRQANTQVDAASRTVRDTADARKAAERRLVDLATHIEDAERGLAAARGVVRGLESSQAVASLMHADELAATLASAARGARDEARLAAQENERRERTADASAVSLHDATTDWRDAADEAAHAADRCGLQDVHAAARPALTDDPRAARAARERVAQARLEIVAQLREMQHALGAAHEAYVRAEDRRQESDDTTRVAVETAAARLQASEAAAEALDDAVLAWHAALAVLSLTAGELDGLRAAASGAGIDDKDATRFLALIAGPARTVAASEIAACSARVEELAARLSDLAAVIATVEHGQESAPQAPPARVREQRPGAPLYLLCDFAGDPDEGLEAALEASGILDAWVSPNGELVALDTVLLPREVDGPTLADVLLATPTGDVSKEAVERILRSVSLGEHGDHWVARDGRWRLGPLHGSWKKDVAEHIGAGARKAARLRRLQDLRVEHDGLAAELAAAESARDAADDRRRLLEGDVDAFPPTSALARTRVELAAADADAERCRTELARCESAAAQKRAARDDAERALRGRAEAEGLAAFVDALDALVRDLVEYRRALGDVANAAQRLLDAQAASDTAAGELTWARTRAAVTASEASRADSRSSEASAELEALRRTVGAEVADVLRRLDAARGSVATLEERLRGLRADDGNARDARGAAEARQEKAREDLDARLAERAGAVEGVRRLAPAGFLDYALESPADDDPAGWSATRVLEVARAVEAACSDTASDAETLERAADATFRQFAILQSALGADFRPWLEQPDGLITVRVTHNAREHTVASLRRVLDDEERQRRSLLEEHERELLEKFLLGEVGTHLRSRLHEARELVDEMNGQMRERPTASAMVITLSWEADPAAGDATKRAVELLRKDVRLLPDQDAQALTRFLQERIAEARNATSGGTWREHLAAALDYRGWHRFRVHKTLDGRTAVLTQREHAAGSGGEKSVALHLPLFAAAAAHYRSAREDAPRLVMLDEAFAGIDTGMRGRCFGLLVTFDLDFVMTSEQEWGTHAELPGVSVYHLARDPSRRGVAAEHLVWNGERLDVACDPL